MIRPLHCSLVFLIYCFIFKVLANKRLRPRKVRKSRLLKPFNKSFRACPSPKCKRKFFGTELKYERHLAIEHLKPKTVQDNGERDLSIEDDYICSNCCRTFGDIKAFGRHLIKSCKNYNCEPSFAVLEAMTVRFHISFNKTCMSNLTINMFTESCYSST